MWVNEGTPTMSFVLYTINVECMCDASYVPWKYWQYRRYHVIFTRKYKTLQNVNILGPDSIVVEPHYFDLKSSLMAIEWAMILKKIWQDWHKNEEKATETSHYLHV